MRLHDLRQMIATSSRDDWHKITCWGAGSGPSYRNEFHYWTSGGSDTPHVGIASHGNLAIFRDDVDLSIAWGLNQEFTYPGERREDDLELDWLGTMANSKARGIYADIFWRGSLVDRELLVAVDGGRALLPMPSPEWLDADGAEEPREWQDVVSPFEVAFARLVHSFEHAMDFDSYFARTKLVVVDRPLEDENK